MIVGRLESGHIPLADRAGGLQIVTSPRKTRSSKAHDEKIASRRAWRPLPFGKG
jgi:hypothetical protein